MYHVLYFLGMIIDGAFSVSYIMIVEYLRSGCSYISIEDVCLRLISLFGCTLTGKKITVPLKDWKSGLKKMHAGVFNSSGLSTSKIRKGLRLDCTLWRTLVFG